MTLGPGRPRANSKCQGIFVVAMALGALAPPAAEAVSTEPSATAPGAATPVISVASRDAEAALDREFRDWLDLVRPLINQEELDFFLALDRDFRKRAFMEKFWEVRDPDPKTSLNELKVQWLSRADEAQLEFGALEDDRAIFFLLNGPPTGWILRTGREVRRCFHKSNELEIWFYTGSDRSLSRFSAIFQRRLGADRYEIWLPDERLAPRQRRRLPTTDISLLCGEELMPLAMAVINNRGQVSYHQLIEELMDAGDPPAEWLATFAAMTTEPPADAPSLSADLDWQFIGRNQSRTVVQGVLSLKSDEVDRRSFGEKQLHQFVLTGELVRDGRLFENFRYRFELPAAGGPAVSEGELVEGENGMDNSDTESGALENGRLDKGALEAGSPEGESSDAQTDPSAVPVPLVFTRYLREGNVQVLLRVEDLYGGGVAYLEEQLAVPAADSFEEMKPAVHAGNFPWLAEANAAAARGERSLRLLPPSEETIHTGMVRFHAQTVGDFDRVTFFLDEKPILTKRRPPFSVELNLGTVAGTHRVRAVGYVEAEEEASDEVAINRGGQRFRVRFLEPRANQAYRESVQVKLDVETPDAVPVDRVEMFLNEERVATLFQAPWVQPLQIPFEELTFLRAVAYLEDGSSAEDVVFVNAPDHLEQIEVQYVEVFAGVYDQNGRPVRQLERDRFRVFEDGQPQQLRRFEWVDDLPIHAGLLIDTSASMEETLEQVSEAALRFVDQAIRPKDRVTLMSFSTRPEVEVRFTNETARIAQVLSGLEPLGSTALYDSLVFAMHYFDGIQGQKALLVLSDGEDEASSFDFDSTLEVARRSGVVVYAIGLERAAKERDARKVLRQLAEETGGQAFFVEDVSGLSAIYDSIQEDLRSRYLLGYQSQSDKEPSEFRAVKVEVDEKQVEVRAMSGYYP